MKTFLICIASLFLVNNAYAGKEGTTVPGLSNPTLVKQFYVQKQQDIVWFTNTYAAKEIQVGFLSLADSAILYGLDKNAYHYNELKRLIDNPPIDSAKRYRADRIFTDALFSYSKDIYQGKGISKWMRYDEVSTKYRTKDDNYLLEHIATIKNISDLHWFALSIVPHDTTYKILTNELRVQLDSNHTAKIKKLNTALNMYRWIHHFHFEQCIVVNIGATILRYYENDSEILSSKVIVGKVKTKTPRFAAHCDQIILYPYWNVPKSIATKELLPKIKRSPSVIDAMDMQVVDSKGKVVNPYSINWHQYSSGYFPFLLRQCTGCDNSLGVIKFNITDPFTVYLHDTNAKKLFEQKRRYYSHGCIRVEKAIDLGNLLLNNKLDTTFLKACVDNQKPVPMVLPKPVPVFVIYSLAEVNDSTVHYFADTYHLY